MLKADKEKIHTFLSGSNQFRIPFFQRQYVWKIDNWEELWENLKEELKELNAKNLESEHFIGTLIIKQAETGSLSAVFDLIDGQQRLTTICLLLRALHDSSDEKAFKEWTNNLLVFTDSYGKSNIRLIHSKVDREYFERIVLDENNNKDLEPSGNRIVEAYLYFKGKIKEEISTEDIRKLVTIVLEKLPVIHMALSKNDDVQQIFDTINSLGVKLTTGELLKNHMFSSKDMEGKFETLWRDVFEADEDAVNFWNKDKTAGRVIRSTIELFLYSYLVITKEDVIKIEALFKEYKQYLKGKPTKDVLLFAKELHDYALLYQDFPDGEDLVEISFNEHAKRFFHVINALDITTALPLVLYIYKHVTDKKERNEIIRHLESYLVRRTICRLTTKNYNNLFISILVDLKKRKDFTSQYFKDKLASFEEDTNRFPDNGELRVAFSSSHLINQYSKEILYCIALYHLNNDFQDKRTLSNSGLSVEHVMPKKWRNYWTIPDDVEEATWDNCLHTLGNLTLVQGKLNSSMRDSEWADKKEALLNYSTLKITTDYLKEPVWNEVIISNRAEDLYKAAIKIWPR